MDLIRDAPIGQIIRYVTGNRLLQYPEEKSDFVCPDCYAQTDTQKSTSRNSTAAPSPSTIEDVEKAELNKDLEGLHLVRTETDRSRRGLSKTNSARSALSRVGSRIALEQSETRADLEHAFAAASESPPPVPERIQPALGADGTILVDWYTTDDPANPQNWSTTKKGVVTSLICIYTTAVYTGSAIYAPSAEGVMERFGVSAVAAALGISLFVLAYGIGPMIFSPLSEIASIGRNPPYITTFAIFTILCVPTALVDNFAGLLVLRFLQGFFGSPILATGGASLQDMFSLIKLPYILCCWAAAACIGPALGPIISGFSVAAMGWRWSLWEMLWLAGPVWLLLFSFLPETYPDNILLRRARRLRAVTGNKNLKAQSEINQAKLTFKDIVVEALIRPVQLMALDPAILYADVYIALCYGIFYSFFEVCRSCSSSFCNILTLSGLPSRVHWAIRLQPRSNGVDLPLHRCRRGHLDRLLLRLPLLRRRARDPEARYGGSRKTPDSRPVLELPCSRGPIHLRMDWKWPYTLDCQLHRCCALRHRGFHPLPVRVRLPAHGIPTIRWIAVCRKRHFQIASCSRSHPFLETSVSELGHRAGCESAWSADCALHRWHLCAVLLRRQVESKESVCSKVRIQGRGQYRRSQFSSTRRYFTEIIWL